MGIISNVTNVTRQSDNTVEIWWRNALTYLMLKSFLIITEKE